MSARIGRAIVSALAACAASATLVACPPLDALSAGREAGADSAPARDATADAADSSERADGGNRDAPAADADAHACDFVDADFAAAEPDPDAACPPGDGSACAPAWQQQYAGYFTLAQPVPHMASCTSTQINDYLNDCPLGAPTSAACTNWQNNPNNSACLLCLEPQDISTASTWGPQLIIPFGQTSLSSYNVDGCRELVDPCNAPCARAGWVAELCAAAVCLPGPCGAQPTTFQSCVGAANACMCASAFSFFDLCTNGLRDAGSPAALCETASFVLAAFCGP